MVQAPSASTVGSRTFDPDAFFESWIKGDIAGPKDAGNFRDAIVKCFGLKPDDQYVYHAIASVTLEQVQTAVNHGGKFNLHAWYQDAEGKQIEPPPTQADIDAYTTIFLSTTSTPKALTAFAANAKKGSIRAAVAANLTANRLFPTTIPTPKLKTPHANPYLDFWAWSCRALEFCGPDAGTVGIRQSHHVLPAFYHHFGCLCPSWEALETIRVLAKGRPVFEIGSGNGYWTYMLRRMGLVVYAVDNGDSVWRTTWINDTVVADGAKFLAKMDGGKDAVLLLVYPQVTTSFTTAVLKGYRGSTLCVAGTQNANGYTAFKDVTIDRYVEQEMPAFEKVVQTPLPSFAAKDEALFVFQRRT